MQRLLPQFLTFSGIALLILLAPLTARADLGLSVSPQKFDFGYTPIGSPPKPIEFTLSPQEGMFLLVEKVEWDTGTIPNQITFSNLPAVGDSLSYSSPLKVSATVSFTSPVSLKARLKITTVCRDGSSSDYPELCSNDPNQPRQTITVSFSARVECAEGDSNCGPKGPECNVDFNTEPYVFFGVPKFKSIVSAPLTEISKKQYSGYKNYTVPLDFVIGLAGLSDLFDPINGPTCACLEQCGIAACQPDMDFIVNFSSPSFSSFSWTSLDGKALVIKSKTNPLYDATITFPAQMAGGANIGASFAELNYGGENFAPKLNLKYIGPAGDYQTGDLIYDGALIYTKSSTFEAILRHPYASGSVPTVHLRAAEEFHAP